MVEKPFAIVDNWWTDSPPIIFIEKKTYMLVFGLILKLSFSLCMLWNLYELRQLDKLITYPRLTRFLKLMEVAFLYFMLARTISAILEFQLGIGTDWFSLVSSSTFFIVIAILIRQKRQKWATEWNNLPYEGATDKIHEAVRTVESTVETLQKMK